MAPAACRSRNYIIPECGHVDHVDKLVTVMCGCRVCIMYYVCGAMVIKQFSDLRR